MRSISTQTLRCLNEAIFRRSGAIGRPWREQAPPSTLQDCVLLSVFRAEHDAIVTPGAVRS